jgi:hypothetical protein
MRTLLAGVPLSPSGGYRGLGDIGDPTNWVLTLASILTSTIGILTFVAAIWFLFTLLTGAIGIISSGGDKAAYEASKKKITNGVVGLVVVIAAVFILDFVAYLLGIPNILDLSKVVCSIVPCP